MSTQLGKKYEKTNKRNTTDGNKRNTTDGNKRKTTVRNEGRTKNKTRSTGTGKKPTTNSNKSKRKISGIRRLEAIFYAGVVALTVLASSKVNSLINNTVTVVKDADGNIGIQNGENVRFIDLITGNTVEEKADGNIKEIATINVKDLPDTVYAINKPNTLVINDKGEVVTELNEGDRFLGSEKPIEKDNKNYFKIFTENGLVYVPAEKVRIIEYDSPINQYNTYKTTGNNQDKHPIYAQMDGKEVLRYIPGGEEVQIVVSDKIEEISIDSIISSDRMRITWSQENEAVRGFMSLEDLVPDLEEDSSKVKKDESETAISSINEENTVEGVSFQSKDYYEIGEKAFNGDKDAQEKIIKVLAIWSILASERIRTSNSKLMNSELKDDVTIGHLKPSIVIASAIVESGLLYDGMSELIDRNNIVGMNWGLSSTKNYDRDLTVDCYTLNPEYYNSAEKYYLSTIPNEILPHWVTYASLEEYGVHVENGNSLQDWRCYKNPVDCLEDVMRFLQGKEPAIADPNLSAEEILTKYADVFDTYGTGADKIRRAILEYGLSRFDSPEEYLKIIESWKDIARFLQEKYPEIVDPNLSAEDLLTKFVDFFDTYETGADKILGAILEYDLTEGTSLEEYLKNMGLWEEYSYTNPKTGEEISY